MARAGFTCFALTLAALAFIGAPAAAQAPARNDDASLAQIGARVLSADRAVDAARDSVNRLIEEMRKSSIPRDSLHVGGITLRLTKSDLSSSTLAVIERAMGLAWDDVQRGLGDRAAVVAATQPVILRKFAVASRLELSVLSFELDGRPGAGNAVRAPLTIDAARTAISDEIGLIAAIGEPLQLDLFAGPWIPAAPVTPDEWSRAAIDLATETSAATRDCFAGSVKRCESALGLTEVNDPVTEWYSPSDWRIKIDALPIPLAEEPGRRERREQCVSGRAPDICEAFMRERPVARPLVTDTRRTVIGLALELGGAQAYSRMMAAHGSSLEVLEAASGLHGDDLITAWRARVLAATPPRVAPQVREVTTMLAWTAIFAFVAFRKRP